MAVFRYHPDADQRALIDAFDRPLEALLPIARLHRLSNESEAAWVGLANLGLFALAAPERSGGTGLGAAEEILLAERLGRRLAAPAVLATMAAVHCGECAAEIAAGTMRVAPAYRTDDRVIVIDGVDAKLLLLQDRDGAALHDMPDATVPIAGDVWKVAMTRGAADDAPLAIADATGVLRMRLIDAAALAGIAGAALDMSVAYASMREQFGRPIGAFQAIKHNCADMVLAARAACDLATFAAIALDDGRDDAPLQVEAALLLAIDAALGNARRNIQVHGGIGFSDEADPHLLLKRAHVQASIAGGSEAASHRLAATPRAL